METVSTTELVRMMEPGDLASVRDLWEARFGDSPAFVDWYFTERFSPGTSACLIADGKLVSAIQGYPMRLTIRDKIVPALMVSGVSTAEGYERRGYMHRVMRYILRLARQTGCPLVFHKPNSLPVYEKLGQLACTRAQRYTVQNGVAAPPEPTGFGAGALLACYTAAVRPYSGAVARDASDMGRRLRDCASDGGRCVTLERGGIVAAYALLSPADGGWEAPEALALDTSAYRALLDVLPNGTIVKLPPDVPVGGEVYAQNAMGAADAPALLRMFVADPRLVFTISDPAVPQNNGTFDGMGNPCDRKANFTLRAGEFVQRIAGYEALPGLLPRQECYCADEY